MQLLLLAKRTCYSKRKRRYTLVRPEPTPWDFTRGLTPPELLDAWNELTGSVESDLTDNEWELLAPLVQSMNGYRGLPRSHAKFMAARRAFDGIRCKYDQGGPWRQTPRRYGATQNLYHRYVNYRDRGDSSRMLQAIQHQPGAGRLAE